MASAVNGDVPAPQRFEALDALRGLAILGMALSGMVPYFELPDWMYHAQLPGPTRDLDLQRFGLTWVDLVFPFFLVSLGAAIPIALGKRLQEGIKPSQLIGPVLLRGLALAAFALICMHFRAGAVNLPSDTRAFAIAFFGLPVMVLAFGRWQPRFSPKTARLLNIAGYAISLLVIPWIVYADGSRGFANYRNDIILMVLANVAVSGSFIWLATRQNALARLAVLGGLVAIFLTSELPGLGKLIWDFTPLDFLRQAHWPHIFDFDNWPYQRFVPILYHFEYHKYLMLVLPGTICGDLLVKALADRDASSGWTPMRYRIVALLGYAASAGACVGLFTRHVIWTTVGLTILGIAMWKLTRDPKGRTERLISSLVAWGGPMLVVGLLAEPIGGGIRKEGTTLSYFFVTAGLAFLFLAALTITVDTFKRRGFMTQIVQTGANPMLGYIVITNLIAGFFGVTGIELWINTQMIHLTGIPGPKPDVMISTGFGPWVLLAWALIKTALVAIVTAWCTRRKIFLRA